MKISFLCCCSEIEYNEEILSQSSAPSGNALQQLWRACMGGQSNPDYKEWKQRVQWREEVKANVLWKAELCIDGHEELSTTVKDWYKNWILLDVDRTVDLESCIQHSKEAIARVDEHTELSAAAKEHYKENAALSAEYAATIDSHIQNGDYQDYRCS